MHGVAWSKSTKKWNPKAMSKELRNKMQEGDRVNNIWQKKHQERFKGNKIKNIENVKNANRKRRRKEEKKYRERAE